MLYLKEFLVHTEVRHTTGGILACLGGGLGEGGGGGDGDLGFCGGGACSFVGDGSFFFFFASCIVKISHVTVRKKDSDIIEEESIYLHYKKEK